MDYVGKDNHDQLPEGGAWAGLLNKRKRLKRDHMPGPTESGEPALWAGLCGSGDAEGREILSSVGTEDFVAEEAQKRKEAHRVELPR